MFFSLVRTIVQSRIGFSLFEIRIPLFLGVFLRDEGFRFKYGYSQ
ncbi:hypothetical protein LEP1GSC068_2886 [Leptospira sp. Fiocruz LV3954]|nr:hypothetical protein LEP1GSC068_2886 [Leptospira sp. Fiocruz LV3954]EMI62941.1 hypothetical protein LEP1GSC076_1576 [Leptospira sp. Fiocruz LV4135]EMM77984.1 hypothetical protein LEP1GSC040_1767 [Leptospira santarosai str. 2000030832]